MKTSFKELSKTPVFTFNEVVECIDFDRSKSRLIVCSVAGKFKAFTVEKNGDYYHFSDFWKPFTVYPGTMIPLWNKEPEEQSPEHGVIPRSVKFVGKGDRIVIFGLQSGIMCVPSALSCFDDLTFSSGHWLMQAMVRRLGQRRWPRVCMCYYSITKFLMANHIAFFLAAMLRSI